MCWVAGQEDARAHCWRALEAFVPVRLRDTPCGPLTRTWGQVRVCQGTCGQAEHSQDRGPRESAYQQANPGHGTWATPEVPLNHLRTARGMGQARQGMVRPMCPGDTALARCPPAPPQLPRGWLPERQHHPEMAVGFHFCALLHSVDTRAGPGVTGQTRGMEPTGGAGKGTSSDRKAQWRPRSVPSARAGAAPTGVGRPL